MVARPFFTMRSVFLNAPKAPRNPRIYKKRIKRAESGIRAGEPVAVRTSDSAFVGRAFYNPRSVIAARILDREEKGPPVDRAWFSGASSRRSRFGARRWASRESRTPTASCTPRATGSGR